MRVFRDTRLHRRGADVKYIFLNSLNALLHPREFLRDLRAIRKIKSSLESLARDNVPPDSKAPDIFHFVWGLSGKSEVFPYYAYMAVASALFYNPGAKAIFHYGKEPSGEFWDRTKSKVILNRVEDFERFGIARLHHFAHKADVVRLLALEVIGGTYLDCDTLTAKSFTPLRKNKIVMGVQASCYNAAPGLCNATIVSPRRDKFLKRWLRKYRSFYSSGRDSRWDYHSVKTPGLLSFYHPSEIEILPFDHFFYPLWTDLPRVLLSNDVERWLPHLDRSYSFHLWNTITKRDLEKINDKFVLESKSVYSHFARPVLAGASC
jgi:hypothetical protein